MERDAFGPRLRSERERRGITLESIAESTKISRGLLAALERNDVSQWPSGIFRRGFVRAYAEAIGIDADALSREFSRLFPETEQAPTVAPRGEEPSAPDSNTATLRELRWPALSWPGRRRLAAAAIDAAAISVPSILLSMVAHVSVLSSLGVIGLAYICGSTAVAGRSLGLALLASPQPAAPIPQPRLHVRNGRRLTAAAPLLRVVAERERPPRARRSPRMPS